ncbi:hypothetical protein D3C87_1988560 [compost metagenome]
MSRPSARSSGKSVSGDVSQAPLTRITSKDSGWGCVAAIATSAAPALFKAVSAKARAAASGSQSVTLAPM